MDDKISIAGGSAILFLSKPNNHLARLLIYLPHSPHLATPFINIILINTYRINPQRSCIPLVAQMPKRDIQFDVINNSLPLTGRGSFLPSSPHVKDNASYLGL